MLRNEQSESEAGISVEKEPDMWEFLNNNWIWILAIGGMLVMHLGHGGHGGHGGRAGCGGHQHSGHQSTQTLPDSAQEDQRAVRSTQHDGHHPS